MTGPELPDRERRLATEGIVDSIPQALLEGRPAAGSLLLTPQQLQQLQRLQAAQEQAGGALTLTLQQSGSGLGPQLVLAPQGFITTAAPTQSDQLLHASQQIGHTTSIQHVLQSSISHHVRQASILQIPAQAMQAGDMRGSLVDKGSPLGSPFSPRSLTPSPSPTQSQHRVATPQPHPHQTVLQLIHQQATTRNSGTVVQHQPSMKVKPPPQILPKPVGGGSPHITSATSQKTAQVTHTGPSATHSSPSIAHPLVLNQMLPNGAVLVQQQTSSGVQLILKSPPHQTNHPKQGLVLANGGLQPQAVIVQGRTQAHQVVRLVPGQMQLQQIQTSSGPTYIAVPTATPQSPSAVTQTHHIQHTPASPAPSMVHKKVKKKKKKEEEHHQPIQHQRLDLANLIKISGIEEEDVSGPVTSQNPITTNKTTATSPQPTYVSSSSFKQQQIHQQTKQLTPSQLLAHLQSPAQLGGSLRLSVGEDGTMLVTQAEQPAVTPSIAAAAQTQLAQLIADHGGQILQANAHISNNASKETSFMQSLQTAVLHLAGSDGNMLLKNSSTPPMVVSAGTGTASAVTVSSAGGTHLRRTPVVMTPSIQQNGVRLVADLNGASLEQQHNRLIVSGLTPAVLEQNRLQIVAGGTAGRVLVSTGSLEQQQNRVQIVTSNSSASTVSLQTEQNRVIVSGDPHSRLQFLPTSNVSLQTEQNRLQIVSAGIHSNMSALSEQNRLIMASASAQAGGSMALEQNRVIMSGVTEQQNRVQILSATNVPTAASNALSLSEQNRVHIVSNLPTSNISLSEKQNLVQIVNSNISLSEEQARLQIVTSIASDQPSRLQIVNSIHPSTANIEQNRVQLVAASVPDSNHLQIVSNLPDNKIHFSSNSIHGQVNHNQQQQVHIVTSLPNSISFNEHGKVQVVTSLPHDKLHFTYKNHISPMDHKGVTNLDHSNVQVVSALVNNETNAKLAPSSDENRTGVPTYKFQYCGRTDQKILNQKETETRAGDEERHLDFTFSHETQTQKMNHHPTVIAEGRTNVFNQQDESSAKVVSALTKSPPRSGGGGVQTIQCTPIGSPPPPQFNNRPNLTVVASSGGNHSPPKSTCSSVATSIENKVSTSTPTSAIRRTYDNAFLDSIAQAHPNLVINKSPTSAGNVSAVVPPAAAAAAAAASKTSIKVKRPTTVKKAALVKPMMAEDRGSNGDKEDHHHIHRNSQTPPNLVPIAISATNPEHISSVVSRVQTIQLTPHKQQQLKVIQAQVSSLTNTKFRTPNEQATLQRLMNEQQKILLGGKLIPTVPGQHAHGLAFVSASANSGTLSSSNVVPQQVRLVPVAQTRSVGVAATCFQDQPQPVPQQAVPPCSSAVPTVTTSSGPVKPSPQPPVNTPSHANKATSPIPSLQQASTQTPALPSPSQPIFSRAKRASLLDQQMQADRQGALAPDTRTPFASKSDAVKRLIRYHTMNEPVLSEKDLAKADELFEQTARHLLDKKAAMYNKFSFLILKDSMRMQKTSELVLLERMFVGDETARLDQIKQENSTTSSPSTASSEPSATQPPSLKREREENDSSAPTVWPKKHCPDDEEINAQVQSAIDSILNLQRKDPTSSSASS